MAQPEGRVISMAGHGDQDLWEWNTKTPTTSVHSGNNFAQYAGSASGATRGNAGSPTGPDMSTMREQTEGLTKYGNSEVATAQMKRNGSIGTQLWNWEADGKKAPSSSPESSEHGSNKMWNWSAGRESPSASVKGGMSRNGSVGSSLWNWGTGRASNPPSLPPSREASSHGGGNFKRTGSMGSMLWDWGTGRRSNPPSVPPSRESSAYAGSHFARHGQRRPDPGPEGTGPDMSTEGESTGLTRYGNSEVSVAKLKRNGSVGAQLWDWTGQEPPSSAEPSEAGMSRSGSVGSSLWNWGTGRESPSASVAGGMSRNGSVGSSLWNWGTGRASNPPSLPPSREASSHGGGNFKRVGSLGSRLSEMGKTPPAANNGPRAASVHGGSYFGGFAGGSHFKRGRTPPTSGPPSRASSVHGGSNFASIAEERPESKPEPKPKTRI